jgi:hypothetical protein
MGWTRSGTVRTAWPDATVAVRSVIAKRKSDDGETANGPYEYEPIMYQFFELHHRVTLQPLSDSDFYVDSRYHTRVSFLRDSSGKVTGALIL